VARRLLATYLTITAFVLLVLVVPLGLTIADREEERLEAQIERDAVAVASQAEDALEAGAVPPLEALVTRYRQETDGRVVVVDDAGVSVVDSDDPGGPRRDFSTRPEIATALSGTRSVGVRHSDTLGLDLLYVAVPAASGGTVHGAVRVTYPTEALDSRVRETWVRLGLTSLVVLVSVTGVGFVLARGVTGPVRDVERAADRISTGDLSARVPEDRGPPELRSLAETFNRTADRLDTLVGAQQRFVADAAHQLRTPLAALRLRLENLEPHLPVAERGRVDDVLAEVQRLSRLVDGLLTLARSEAEPPTLPGPVDLHAAVVERVDAWRGPAEEQDVALVTEVPEGLVVSVQPTALPQVLDNLVSNALRVSPAGSRVRVRGGGRDDLVELHVVDEGPGLDEVQRERAFDRFWRGDATGEGSGLGLAVVRRLVTYAGGDVRLDPGPGGRGLDAVVTLRRSALPAPREAGGGSRRRQTFTGR
jgi:signal transduction histidine kinase